MSDFPTLFIVLFFELVFVLCWIKYPLYYFKCQVLFLLLSPIYEIHFAVNFVKIAIDTYNKAEKHI